MQSLFQKSNILPLILLVIISTMIFLPMNYAMVNTHPHNDYKDHIQFAVQLLEGIKMPAHITAHPAWQYSLVFFSRIFDIGIKNTAVIIQTVFDLLLVLILFGCLRVYCKSLTPGWISALALGASIAAPLMLLTFDDSLFYLGYIGISSFHNPTMIMLRPFALPVFLYCIGLAEGKHFSIWHVLLSAVLIIVSALAKPSLLVCLLPALGILLLIKLIRHEKFDWRFTIFGICLPSAAILAWQFLGTYGGEEAGFLFAPLAVMQEYSNHLLFKLILSIWFPLLVIAAYWKTIWHNKYMPLAALTFFFGAAYTYLLSEGAARFQDGNWGWSGEIALFLLFVSAMIFFFTHKSDAKPAWVWKAILWLGFVPHIVAGVVYYIYVFTSGTFI